MSDLPGERQSVRALDTRAGAATWRRVRTPSEAGSEGPTASGLDERERRFRLERDLERTRAELQAAQRQLDLIVNSRFWRYSHALRETLSLLRPGRDASRAMPLSRLRMHARSARALWELQGTAALARKVLWVLLNGIPPSPREERVEPSLPPPPPPNRRIEFEECADPLVSIIIPVLDNYNFTYACLESVLDTALGTSYEVIVVDDGSTDETTEIEHRSKGVRVIRHERTLGFTLSCNDGARTARGDYLVFLNNDTVVQPGWLTALIQTFRSQPGAGLVGAKLVYPGGRLQEDGGIIWRAGTAENYGRFGERWDPEYNYLREVDYCSGACIAIPRALFEEIRGFDERYTPAYYEDADLAFSVRRAGRRVLYQPECEVVHFEGATAGNAPTAGAKRYQQVNRAKFLGKWETALDSQPEPGAGSTRASSRTPARRLLVIDARTPVATRDAGSERMLRILGILRDRGVHVSFLPEDMTEIPAHTATLQQMGVRALHSPFVSSIRQHLRSQGRDYDAVVLSRRDVMARHVRDVRKYCPAASVLFDTVDLHFLREAREAQLHDDKRSHRAAAARMKLELRLAQEADMTWVVSEAESQTLAQHAPHARIEVVSTIHEVSPPRHPFHSRDGIVFVGNFEHPPNADAIRYFLDEIYPLVRSQLGDVTVTVIGGSVPRDLLERTTARVGFTGSVEDIEHYFERCRLSIAPLRFGAGVKGKINTSMSFGVPVVATSLAVEGMHTSHGKEILVCDDPAAFARAITRLHQDEALWNELSKNSLQHVENHFSPAVAARTLERVFRLEGDPDRSRRPERKRRPSPHGGDLLAPTSGDRLPSQSSRPPL